MLIPLGMASAGPLNSIDTTSITDSRVIEQLREESDRNIETRQDMVDLKERQAEEAAQTASTLQEAVRQEEQRQTQERTQAREEQQAIDQARQESGADQKALDERQEALDEKNQELDQRQEELEEQKEEAQQIEQFADQKAEEAQIDRQDIAENQQDLIDQEKLSRGPSQGILAAAILIQDGPLGRLVKIDPADGSEKRRSSLTTINIRSLVQVDGKLIAIAGENQGNGAVRLVEINPDTLEMVKQGDDDIAPNSLLWVQDSNIYAIVSANGSLYIARFNTDLDQEARSNTTVHPFAAIGFVDNWLTVQRADGGAVLLDAQNLIERQ
jgi:hypothetical protein